MSKSLKKLMKKVVSKDITEEMAVADAKIGNIIKVRHVQSGNQNYLISMRNITTVIYYFNHLN